MCAASQTSHPVDVECPSCSHRFRVPLNTLSVGERLSCRSCGGEILIATSALRQLLREIDKDLHTPDDRPLLLQPGRGGSSEMVDFMLLQLINRHLGQVSHAYHLDHLHPERLFADWLQFATELASFSAQHLFRSS